MQTCKSVYYVLSYSGFKSRPSFSMTLYYIYLRRLIRGGIAGADCQTVELQVFLSAGFMIRIGSISELLRGKWHLPARERRISWPVAQCFKALHIACQQLRSPVHIQNPAESFFLLCHEFYSLSHLLDHLCPWVQFNPSSYQLSLS